MGQLKRTLYLMIPIFISLLPIEVNSKEYKVHGRTVDKNNSGINGILVTVYRGNTKVGEDRSEKEGKKEGYYSITFKDGDPITDIFYECTGWISGYIHDLSGKENHLINKALYRTGEETSKNQKENFTTAISRRYDIEKANNMSDKRFFQKYGNMIASVNLPISMQLRLPPPIQPYSLAMYRKPIKKDMITFINSDGSFEYLTKLIKVAGLEHELKLGGPFTVIAPIDSAFAKLPAGTLATILKDRKKAETIVKAQIIQGKANYRYLLDKRIVESMGKRSVDFCKFYPVVKDIHTKNGIVHVVDNFDLRTILGP